MNYFMSQVARLEELKPLFSGETAQALDRVLLAVDLFRRYRSHDEVGFEALARLVLAPVTDAPLERLTKEIRDLEGVFRDALKEFARVHKL